MFSRSPRFFRSAMTPARFSAGKPGRRHDGHRGVGDQAERGEAAGDVVGQLAEQRGAGGHADVVDQQRVAVGLRLHHALRPDDRPADALDHHRLVELPSHAVGDDAGDGVGRPARGAGGDDGDGAAGEGFLRPRAGAGEQRAGRRAGGGALGASWLSSRDGRQGWGGKVFPSQTPPLLFVGWHPPRGECQTLGRNRWGSGENTFSPALSLSSAAGRGYASGRPGSRPSPPA